ncbi:MAG TPA: DNA gyrase subunit A [Clostridia bacterium]|nr:DNA gyrase subunit A [Clostridia bacterium]
MRLEAESLAKVLPVEIEKEMSHSYMDYAMSVIVSRALPDVRDGLKPVHRRILWSMQELGMGPDKPYKKSARVVGEVMGKYHPHGDAAIYEAVVRLAQDFSTRYPLVDGHGNFGSVDGDPPAAMRYTEIRLSRAALQMLRDIDKETVDFGPNFDESLKEPLVLPSRFPNLLANGSSGIAVGMATNIPPHNLGELIDAAAYLIDNPDAALEDLLAIVPGPDFPTGGLIMGRDGIRSAYATGRGTVVMRARASIEPDKGGKNRIVITELPYQVNKAKLIEHIAELIRDKRIDGVADLRDETDRSGLRIVIELRRDANPRVVLNRLYTFTEMQQTFGIIMLALVNGRPEVLSLKRALTLYVEHQKDVIVRRTRFDLKKAEERAHILEGLRIALSNLDAVIKLIRSSKDVQTAREGLMGQFGLSEKQAQAILDMRLQRLTQLERAKIEEEYEELRKTIEYLRAVLASEKMVDNIIKAELREIKESFADERRTTIVDEVAEMDPEDLVKEEDVVVAITHGGYIKRCPVSAFPVQHRGGRGLLGIQTREEDFVEHLFTATTHQSIMFFTNRGKVYRLKVLEVPEFGRQARGQAIVNLLDFEPEEKVSAILVSPPVEDGAYVVMGTAKGLVKKTPALDFKNVRTKGIAAINLLEGDELIGARITEGDSQIMLFTKNGMALRFPEDNVRPSGRTSRGVKGITLPEGDEVVALETVRTQDHGFAEDVLLVADDGFGKRTRLDEYSVHSRGGKGIKAIALERGKGRACVAGARLVREDDEIMIISSRGILIHVRVKDVARKGRVTRGVVLMKLEEGDSVVSIARV